MHHFTTCAGLLTILSLLVVGVQSHSFHVDDKPNCPQHIGPPCPVYYKNPYPDYHGGNVSISPQLRRNMTRMREEYLSIMLRGAPPSLFDSNSVMAGVAGRALMFLHLYLAGGGTNASLLHVAEQYVENSIAHMEETPKKLVGFLYSYIGVSSVAAVTYDLLGMQEKSDHFVSLVRDAFATAHFASVPGPYDGGKAGLMFAAQYLNHYFVSIAGKPAPFNSSYLEMLAYQLIDEGVATGNRSYMSWKNYAFPNIIFIGQGHGSSGILYRLLQVPSVVQNSTAMSLIRSTLDGLLSMQFADGNFPTPLVPPYPAKPDVLVQWCHGSPGFIPLMTEAWKVLGDAKYLASAELAAQNVWEKGILTKGLMLGHGISGNTYMQMYLYRHTKNPKYLYRAIAFQEYVLTHPICSDPAIMRKPTPSPYMFFTGSYAGAIVLWTDMLKGEWEDVRMPAFEA